MKIYPVVWNENKVGEVTVRQEGLYYRFHCRADIPKDDIYRLRFCGKDVSLDLGVFIPVNGYFEVDKKIPSKQLQDDDFSFKIVTKIEKERFVPVYEDTPFAALAEVHLGRFVVRNGVSGVILS